MAQAEEITAILHEVQPKPDHVLIIGGHATAFKKLLTCKTGIPDVGENQIVDYLRSSPENFFDAIIANSVVEHFGFDDADLRTFFETSLRILKDDGVLIFREDLEESSAKGLAAYTDLLDVFRVPADEEGQDLGFSLVAAQEIQSSIKKRQNWLDIVWVFKKALFPHKNGDSEPATLRQFLDEHQYKDSGIGAYEWIFGAGFISPGGFEENVKFTRQLNLEPGERVLDVGCGIGGNAFHMAKDYDVEVVGADLSSNMLSVAMSRAGRDDSDTNVSFILADVMSYDFPPQSFDAIYSRDCIIHISDKEALFKRFERWLKPGGRVVMTDYCIGEAEITDEFKAYLADRQYGLRTISFYVKSFEAAGFEDVVGEDLTERFREILLQEIDKAEQRKVEFSTKFPGKSYDDLVSGWKNKLGYIAAGNHKWALFKANKPT